MIRILIIEDEEPALKRLWKMVRESGIDFEPVGSIVAVADGIQWLKNNPEPDLILSDIQLSDGTSFDIFREIQVHCPVIFTTAYDSYALDAFKVNSIDYLLKPVNQDNLNTALKKYSRLNKPTHPAGMIELLETLKPINHGYKTRFIVKYGEHLKTIPTGEIAFLYTEDKIQFITTFEGKRYSIDFNMDNLEHLLEPKSFFRINRQYIISIGAIAEMTTHSKSRVFIKLNPPAKHETIVSAERSAAFKAWLDDNMG